MYYFLNRLSYTSSKCPHISVSRIHFLSTDRFLVLEMCHVEYLQSHTPQLVANSQDACTHTCKIGAGSESGAGYNVNKWLFSHAAGPAELPVQQISVSDWNSTSRAPG